MNLEQLNILCAAADHWDSGDQADFCFHLLKKGEFCSYPARHHAGKDHPFRPLSDLLREVASAVTTAEIQEGPAIVPPAMTEYLPDQKEKE